MCDLIDAGSALATEIVHAMSNAFDSSSTMHRYDGINYHSGREDALWDFRKLGQQPISPRSILGRKWLRNGSLPCPAKPTYSALINSESLPSSCKCAARSEQ